MPWSERCDCRPFDLGVDSGTAVPSDEQAVGRRDQACAEIQCGSSPRWCRVAACGSLPVPEGSVWTIASERFGTW